MNSNTLTHSFHQLLWDAACLYSDEPDDEVTVAIRNKAIARWLRMDDHTLRRRLQRLERHGRVRLNTIDDELWVDGNRVSPMVRTLTVTNPERFSPWHREFAACRMCGSTESRHGGDGWCRRCYQQVTRKHVAPKPKVSKPRKEPVPVGVFDFFLEF